MTYTMEGTIEIDLVEFWEFVMKYVPSGEDEIIFGVPRFNQSNGVMEIDFASSSDNDPNTWSKKPKTIRQWESYECKP